MSECVVQHGGAEHGGPEHGETEHGDAQHGEPEHGDAQHGQTKVSNHAHLCRDSSRLRRPSRMKRWIQVGSSVVPGWFQVGSK